MVFYECKRCGYNTKHKGSFINHLNRKNICPSILENVSINEMKNTYGFEISENSLQNSSKTPQNPPKFLKILKMPPTNSLQNSSKKSSKILRNSSKILRNEKFMTCPYCYKEFTRSDNLNRHYGRCKIKKRRNK